MEKAYEAFRAVIRALVGGEETEAPLCGVDVAGQFRPDDPSPDAALRNLNAAFLIVQAGAAHPLYARAEAFIFGEGKSGGTDAAAFYRDGISLVRSEIEERCEEDRGFFEKLSGLARWLGSPENRDRRREAAVRIREIFFPEGIGIPEDRDRLVAKFREKRSVRIERLNPDPIRNPAEEILWTSNVLLTVPAAGKDVDGLAVPETVREKLRRAAEAPQRYWYDHPMPVGVAPEQNELLYGLRGLDRAVAFEKARGTVPGDAKLSCLLSISVTHEGLQDPAGACLQEMVEHGPRWRHLRVWALSETDCSRITREVLLPAVRHYPGCGDGESLHAIIGVDGEYGRHYSFLKAISAFWQVFMDPRVRATFKIDLDQIFPQDLLVKETGASAFQHLRTPLWGALGRDREGERVELGMIAGALVNQKDAARSLFTPDVGYPEDDIRGDEWIFQSRLPQALSTEFEMMTRYGKGALDGKTRCLQRVHVTGGTCGILVDSLRRFRPFTPGFIGRAEDQAYLLAGLYRRHAGKLLRYVHKDGLIMRHDKEGFAADAVKSAVTGKELGDYIRILLFSLYAGALPWPSSRIKAATDPFTGCFISAIPHTLVYLRLALRASVLFGEGKGARAVELIETGSRRLHTLVRDFKRHPDLLRHRYVFEKKGWDCYYRILDQAEKGLARGEPFSLDLRRKAMKILDACELRL